jgi:hypothetical protein
MKSSMMLVVFAAAALAQQGHDIHDVAGSITPPAWVVGTEEYLLGSAHSGAVGNPGSNPCSDFLIAPGAVVPGFPAATSAVEFFSACDTPAGTYFVTVISGGGKTTTAYWQTSKDIPARSGVDWTVPNVSTGEMFTLAVIFANGTTSRLQANINGALPLQAAYEKITPAQSGSSGRTIVLQGFSDPNLRALFNGVDISNRLSVQGNTATWDVTDFIAPQGVMYPLTVVQGPQGASTTILVFHPACPNAACAVAPVPQAMLSASAEAFLSDQTVSAGAAFVKIGSYAVTLAPQSAQSARISSVSILVSASYLQNLEVLVNGVQFGATQASAAPNRYTFSGSPIVIPPGRSVQLDVVASIASGGVGTYRPATTLVGLVATDTAYTPIPLAAAATGQALTIVQGGPIVSIGIDPVSTYAHDAVMGSTGNPLSGIRITNSSVAENARLTDLTITDKTSSAKPAVTTLRFFSGSALLGTSAFPVPVSGGFAYSFHFPANVVIPLRYTASFSVSGDIATYASGGAEDASLHTFVPTAAIVVGTSSNQAGTVTVSSANGGTIRVLRTALSVTANQSGGIQHLRNYADNLATITFGAVVTGPAAIQRLRLTFNGTAAQYLLSSAVLLDQNNQIVPATVSVNTGTGVVTWTFASGYVIAAGSSSTFTLRVNSTLVPSVPMQSQTLGVSIAGQDDVLYADGLDPSATGNINLSAVTVPVAVATVVYQ